MSAWGKTGRVTIRSGSTRGVYNDIHVDGEHVGNADHLPSGWQARAFDGKYGSAEAPSLDAAVLWVLRRVDPALWRQERGAWLVRKVRGGEWVEDGWYTGTRYPAFPGWAIVDPDGKCRASAVSMTSAANAARRYVAEAVAR